MKRLAIPLLVAAFMVAAVVQAGMTRVHVGPHGYSWQHSLREWSEYSAEEPHVRLWDVQYAPNSGGNGGGAQGPTGPTGASGPAGPIAAVQATSNGGIAVANPTSSPVISQSQPVFYVQDTAYGGGAKCNDSTNDATAIGDALSAAVTAATASNSRAIVQLPTGLTCKINSGITVNTQYVSLQGNGSKLDCSGLTSGICVTYTGSSSTNPGYYQQSVVLAQGIEFDGPGSGTAGVTGVKLGTISTSFAQLNLHDFATGLDLSGNNSFNARFYGVDIWNTITAITTGSGAPTNSGETFDFYGGTIFNSTTGVSMLNTGGGYSLAFFGTHFDGMTGSTFVLATGASETAQAFCHGCHIEYNAQETATDMVQIGGANAYTQFTSDAGTTFQTDSGSGSSINSLVNDSGSGVVRIDDDFESITAGYTTGRVIGSGAANVAIVNGLNSDGTWITNGYTHANVYGLQFYADQCFPALPNNGTSDDAAPLRACMAKLMPKGTTATMNLDGAKPYVLGSASSSDTEWGTNSCNIILRSQQTLNFNGATVIQNSTEGSGSSQPVCAGSNNQNTPFATGTEGVDNTGYIPIADTTGGTTSITVSNARCPASGSVTGGTTFGCCTGSGTGTCVSGGDPTGGIVHAGDWLYVDCGNNASDADVYIGWAQASASQNTSTGVISLAYPLQKQYTHSLCGAGVTPRIFDYNNGSLATYSYGYPLAHDTYIEGPGTIQLSSGSLSEGLLFFDGCVHCGADNLTALATGGATAQFNFGNNLHLSHFNNDKFQTDGGGGDTFFNVSEFTGSLNTADHDTCTLTGIGASGTGERCFGDSEGGESNLYSNDTANVLAGGSANVGLSECAYSYNAWNDVFNNLTCNSQYGGVMVGPVDAGSTSGPATITNSNITSNQNNGLMLWVSGTQASGNTVTENGGAVGAYIQAQVQLTNNTFNFNNSSPGGNGTILLGSGVTGNATYYSQITGNTVNCAGVSGGCADGIVVQDPGTSITAPLTISGNQYQSVTTPISYAGSAFTNLPQLFAADNGATIVGNQSADLTGFEGRGNNTQTGNPLATYTNSTAQTGVYGFTLNAGYLGVPGSMTCSFEGDYENNSGSAATATMVFSIGSVSIPVINGVSFTSGSAVTPLDTYLTIYNDGSNTTHTIAGFNKFSTTGAGTGVTGTEQTLSQADFQYSQVTGFNQSVNNNITMSFQSSAASTNIIYRLFHAQCWRNFD